ncbi:prepilin peptidase [bacterium]|nr:prepilin peptidase [bacterium]
MLGSFLNVCIYRLPRGESVVTPRSHCPRCGRLIPWYENVPVVSWIFLRGRCRGCRGAISIQYPLVELAAACLAAGSWLRFGASWDTPAMAVLLLILLGILVTDLQTYTIPDSFSLGGLAAGVAFSFLPGGISPLQAALGTLIGGGVLYLAAVAGQAALGREAMGGGDIKMLAAIGAFTGWTGVLFTLFAGSVAGSLIYGWINYVQRRKRLVPFGVFLALGAALYVFRGRELTAWYLGLFHF